MSAPTLSNGTVTIRELTEDDVQGCYEQCIDPQSIQWTQVPSPYSRADARDFCLRFAPEAWADGSQWIFAVASGGRYAGNIALRDEGHGRAEVAFGAHPAARGTGAMEAALRLLLEWGFTTQRLRTVIWRANVGNWASRNLAWRLGFTLDGVLRQSQLSRGELVDAWVGTLLAGDPREPSGRWLRSPLLEGDGVRLRPFGDGDIPRVIEACSDERTQRWLGRMASPYTAADARAWYEMNAENQATGSGTFWAVTAPDADVALGSIELFHADDRSCEIGFWTHPDARGRGVTRAAMRVVTSWAFDELGVRQVCATAAVDNAASRHVMEACGFSLAGVERLGTTVRDTPGGTGRPADAARYDVLAEEWARR